MTLQCWLGTGLNERWLSACCGCSCLLWALASSCRLHLSLSSYLFRDFCSTGMKGYWFVIAVQWVKTLLWLQVCSDIISYESVIRYENEGVWSRSMGDAPSIGMFHVSVLILRHLESTPIPPYYKIFEIYLYTLRRFCCRMKKGRIFFQHANSSTNSTVMQIR